MKKTAFYTVLVYLMLTIAGLFHGTGSVGAASQPPNPGYIDAVSAILIDQATGQVLYEKKADKQMFPASTTKILTALVAAEHGSLDEVVTVGSEVLWISLDSSKAGLRVGDQITLRELIYGMMLPSGNDAAYTIAVHIGRKAAGPDISSARAVETFAQMMNQRARELGALSSNFTVPDGYHDNKHYTTAHDLARIAQAAMQNEFIREVAGTGRYEPETWIGPDFRAWGNVNQLVRSYEKHYYEKATGLKSGYTEEAGFCMVSSGTHNGLDLIAVVMDTTKDGRWTESSALLEYGFDNFAWLQLVEENAVVQSADISGQDRQQPESTALIAVQGFGGVFTKADLNRIEKNLVLDEDLLDKQKKSRGAEAAGQIAPTLKAPLVEGQVVGELVFTLDGVELFRTDVVAADTIAALPWWRKALLPGALTLGLGGPCVLAVNIRQKKRRRRYIRPGRFGL